MSSPFKKPSAFAGASYFKPAEFETALALLVEPKSIEKDVESTYNNVTRTRDEVIADITVFANSEALESGEPTEILKSAKVTHGMLTSTLEKIMGEALVGVVRKIPTRNGAGYVFRDVDAEPEAQVAGYWEKRESAAADAPDFD